MPKTDYQFNLHSLKEYARKKGNLLGQEAIGRWIERSKGWEREPIHQLVRGLQSLIEDAQRNQRSLEDILVGALARVEYYEAIRDAEALHQDTMQRLSIWERFEIEIKRAVARRDALVMVSLQRDLEREIEQAKEFAQRWEKDAPKAPDLTDRAVLRKTITRHFDIEEIRNLCFDLGIEYDSFPSQAKTSLARELVSYCERNERIEELAELVKESLPNA